MFGRLLFARECMCCPFEAQLLICVVHFLPMSTPVAHLKLGRQFLAHENMCCPFSSLAVSQTKLWSHLHTWGCLYSYRSHGTGKISEIVAQIWWKLVVILPSWARWRSVWICIFGELGWNVLLSKFKKWKWFLFFWCSSAKNWGEKFCCCNLRTQNGMQVLILSFPFYLTYSIQDCVQFMFTHGMWIYTQNT